MMREYEEMIFKSARWRSFKEEGGGKHHCVYDTWRLQWRGRVASDNLAICCVQREMIAWLPPWSWDTTLLFNYFLPPPVATLVHTARVTCIPIPAFGECRAQIHHFACEKVRCGGVQQCQVCAAVARTVRLKRAKNSCYHDVGTFVFTDIFEYIKPTRHPTIHCRIILTTATRQMIIANQKTI